MYTGKQRDARCKVKNIQVTRIQRSRGKKIHRNKNQRSRDPNYPDNQRPEINILVNREQRSRSKK
jgi:hypothetical protein